MKKKYTFVETTDREKLELLVNEALEKGWEISGGMAVSTYEEGDKRLLTVKVLYAQAFVRNVEE